MTLFKVSGREDEITKERESRMKLLRAVLQKNRGFTLIELMITMVVAVVGLLSLMAANVVIEQRSDATFVRTLAIQDAHQVIEQMRNAADTASSDEPFQTNVTRVGASAAASVRNLPKIYNDNKQIVDNEQIVLCYRNSDGSRCDETTADPLDVTVTVTWQEHGLRIWRGLNVPPRSAALRALITKRS